MDEILNYHVQHFINGSKAVEANTKLAESLKLAMANEKTFRFNLRKLVSFPRSKLVSMEDARLKGERKLKKAIKNVCKQSIKELSKPSAKRQKKAKQAISKLKTECESFYQLINSLSEQFDAEFEKNDSATDNTDLESDPHANLLESMAKLTKPNRVTDPTVKENEVSQIPEVKSSPHIQASQAVCLPSSSAAAESNQLEVSQVDKKLVHLQRLLHILKGVLTPIQNYTFTGEFGQGGQGMVYKAQTDDGTAVALKLISITKQNYMNIVVEALLVSNEHLAHSNLISAIKCSVFKEKEKFVMAMSFEPMLDGDLSLYRPDKNSPDTCFQEDQVACIMQQALLGLDHLHRHVILLFLKRKGTINYIFVCYRMFFIMTSNQKICCSTMASSRLVTLAKQWILRISKHIIMALFIGLHLKWLKR